MTAVFPGASFTTLCILLTGFAMCMASSASAAGNVPAATASELRSAREWGDRRLTKDAGVPFSFFYGRVKSDVLLPEWRGKSTSRRVGSGVRERTRIWRDPKTGLEVRCTATFYSDYPVVEWTVTFKNTGSANTPILEKVHGLDIPVYSTDRMGSKTFGDQILHGLKGDFCTADSYEPFSTRYWPGVRGTFSPPGSGKSCDGPKGWPYFNLQMRGGGTILAIGWPGQWEAQYDSLDELTIQVIAGQQRTHLYLKPGEQIRTPSITLLMWQGADLDRSYNLWRRWYMAHVLPRIKGVPQGPISQIQVEGSEANIADVKAVLAAGIKPDICWRDAGGTGTWYPSATGPYKGGDVWLNTGTWDVDTAKYPKGFKPFSDFVHSKGMQFLLWFEPERAGDPNSYLGAKHPEWLLPGSSHGGILNLGDQHARNWLEDHIDTMIKSQGLDWYREDMNGVGPGPAWRRADAPDRVGITENLYVQGHLAFWDTLRQRNPGLHIDSCASGGRRNDLESMRRAVPLLRSDFQFPDMPGVVEGNQAQTWALSKWLPFQGTGCYFPDLYSLRSFYLPGYGTVGTSAVQKQVYAECARIAPMMMADYYPMTEYSRDANRWIAWQFNRPEQRDGVVQVFRRKECREASLVLKLKGLDAGANYEITDFDKKEKQIVSGQKLMTDGLTVELPAAPASAVILYRITPAAGKR